MGGYSRTISFFTSFLIEGYSLRKEFREFREQILSFESSLNFEKGFIYKGSNCYSVKVVVVLLFYVHGKHLRSCWDGHLT